MIGLVMATGWLPSQIENEDFGTLVALVKRLNERAKANDDARKEIDFNRQLMVERKTRGM